MSSASELKRCPKCGGPIPAEAPQGLCPQCLLLQASLPTEAGAGPSPKSPPPTLEELAVAFPQLEILGLIGQGGMGFVFKARQPKLQRFVALKILSQSLAVDPAFAERFTREGRALARLNHPNIVTIHDFGETNGFFYLLMEYVDGVNLRQAMKVGRFTPGQALAIVPKICDALQFAHNEGILHRDIKPENILLDAKGRVKIADFGIAKITGTESGRTADGSLQSSDVPNATGIIGTPQYMAPEQIEHPKQADQRADVYSLGVVFYEMLTGELPLGRFAPPSEKSTADPRLDEVVMRALEKEPERRTQSAGEMKTQVETFAGSTSVAPYLIESKPIAEKSKSFTLREFAPHLRSGALVGCWVFLVVASYGIITALRTKKVYLAAARVEVYAVQAANYDPYRIETEKNAILSRETLLPVLRSLSLSSRWGNRFQISDLKESECREILRRQLQIRGSQNTGLLEIGCFAESPEEAAEIANKVADIYCALPPGIRGRIIDRAIPPAKAFRPNFPLYIGVGILVGLPVGVCVAFALFSFSRRNRDSAREIPKLQPSAGASMTTRSPALISVALCFVFFGFLGLWSFARHLGHRYSAIELAVFGIPIGIGLLRYRPWWRFAAFAYIAVSSANLISILIPVLFGYSLPLVFRVSRQTLTNGLLFDSLLARATFAVFLFFAYRTLRRPSLKQMFGSTGFSRPWIEWSVLGIAFVVLLGLSRSNEKVPGSATALLGARPSPPMEQLTPENRSFVAYLAQGTIELVAVGTGDSHYPSTNLFDWWRPDGERIERLRYQWDAGTGMTLGDSDSMYGRTECINRQLVFKMGGLPPGASDLCLFECMPAQGWSFPVPAYLGNQQQPEMTLGALTFPTNVSAIAQMKVGVATDAWTNSPPIGVPRYGGSSGTSFIHQLVRWKIHIQDVSEINGMTKVIAYHTENRYWQAELVLVDFDNKEWPLDRGGYSETSEGLRHLSGTCNLPAIKIKEIHLRVRPYHWVEFRNVSLQPGQRTEVGILDAIGTKNGTNSLVSSAKNESVSAIGSFHLISAGSHLNLVMARAESLIGYPIHQIVARFAGPSLQSDQWNRARFASLGTLAPAPEEKLGEGWRPEPVESKSIWNGTPGSTAQHSSEVFECPNECQLQFALGNDEEAKEAVRQLNLVLGKPMDLFHGKKIKLFQVGEREAWLEIREFQAAPGRLGFTGVWDRNAGKSPVYLKAAEKDPFRPAVHSAVISIPPQAELDLKFTLSETPSPLFSTTLENKADKPGVYWLTWYAIDASNTPAAKGPSWEIFIHDAQTAQELRHLTCARKSKAEWQSCDWGTDATNESSGITIERLLFYAPDPSKTEPNRNKGVDATMIMRRKSTEASNKESSDEIVRLKLKFAEERVKEAEKKLAVGAIDPLSVEKTVAARDIIVAEMKGDAVEAARIKLRIAESEYSVAERRRANGVDKPEEYENAKLACDLALISLRKLQKAKGP